MIGWVLHDGNSVLSEPGQDKAVSKVKALSEMTGTH